MLLHPLEVSKENTRLYRVVFGGPKQATLSPEAPVTAAEVARALAAVHGPDTRLGRLRGGNRFSDASRQVSDYRVGRVLFASDATHLHSPIGGQGLNLGVQDAVNLGWKLAAQVWGDAPEGLLDSYHAERHPVAARVIATTRAQSVLMSPPPDADNVLALREPDGPDRPVGSRMPDLDLRTAQSTTTRVSTLLRTGRGLLLELGATSTTDRLPAGVDRVIARLTEVADSNAAPGIGTDTGAGLHASPTAAFERWSGARAPPPADFLRVKSVTIITHSH